MNPNIYIFLTFLLTATCTALVRPSKIRGTMTDNTNFQAQAQILVLKTYADEAWRELKMRKQVYPGRVKAGKMTERSAYKKIRIMEEIANVFELLIIGHEKDFEINLPIYQPNGEPKPIRTLEPHIDEIESEIQWRKRRITSLIGATKELAQNQLALMIEMKKVLIKIQDGKTEPTQQTLF